MKLKVCRGNTFHQCAWIVKLATHKHNFETIAEFWDRKDAQLFCKIKRIRLKVEKYETNNS